MRKKGKSFALLPLLALGSSFLQQKHEIFILLWALQIFGPPCRMSSGSLLFSFSTMDLQKVFMTPGRG